MAGAEVVQCDQESAFAEELHGFAEAQLVPHALFQDFDDDPMRRQAGCVEQVGEEIVVVHTLEEYFGVHEGEQPAVRPEMQEIVHVDSAREPVEGHDVREILAHAEGIERRNRIAVRVRRTHQTFESHRATVGNAENRLEMTANFEACEISDGLFGARLQQTPYRLQVYTGTGQLLGIRRFHRALTSDPLILAGKTPDSGGLFVASQSGESIIRKFNELQRFLW